MTDIRDAAGEQISATTATEPIDSARYRSLLVKELAQGEVDRYLAAKWLQLIFVAKIAGPVALLLVALAGFREYRLQSHLEDVQTRFTNLHEQAEGQLKTLEGLMGEAKENASKASAAVASANEFVTGSSQAIMQNTASLLTTRDEFMRSALEARNVRNKVETDAKVVDEKALTVGALQAEVETKAKVVKELHKSLIDDEGGLTSLKRAREALRVVGAELRRVKATETIVLEPGRSSLVELPDPVPDELTLRYFEIRIAAHDANKDIDLEYQVKEPGGSTLSSHTVRAYRSARRGEPAPQIIPVAGTPFEILVEYIATGIFVNDFVILKIRPSTEPRVTSKTIQK